MWNVWKFLLHWARHNGFYCRLIAISLISAPLPYLYRLYSSKRAIDKKGRKMKDLEKDNDLLLFFDGVHHKCACNPSVLFDCFDLRCNFGQLSYMLDYIRNCQKSLDICMYILSAKQICDLLIDLHECGVQVRVILGGSSEASKHLKLYGIPVRLPPESEYLMHHKFTVVDNKLVITGSMNLTRSGIHCNYESVIITSDPVPVSQFSGFFEAFWNDLGQN